MSVIDPTQRSISSTGWQALYFSVLGAPVPPNCRLAPLTARLLAQPACASVRMARFSVLSPGVSVPKHRGQVRMMGRYQLGLIVPEPELVTLRFTGPNASDAYHWQEGEGLLWDDLFEHEVVNNGTRSRTILMIDFERADAPPRARLICALLLRVVRLTRQYAQAYARMVEVLPKAPPVIERLS